MPDDDTTMESLLGDILDRLDALEQARGCSGGAWVAYYSDWSGFAIFGTELDALRYANDRSMIVGFKPWGEIR